MNKAVWWDLLPQWVAWVAQDEDGSWWGYECEPLQHDHGWYENEVGRSVRLAAGEANAQWRATAQRVERHP